MKGSKHSGSLVKVAIYLPKKDGESDVETLWAKRVGQYLQLDNIPFYAKGLAWGDVISVENESDGLFRFSGLVAASGHSTLRLWVARTEDVKAIRDYLRSLSCESELDLGRLIAVNVPPNVPYTSIKKFLDEQERMQILEYEEACLAQ
jgi:hypothetical protein